MSADGRTIIIDSFSGILVSPDTASTWYLANGPRLEVTVMSSADGKTWAAFNGAIYLSLPPPSQSGVLSVSANSTKGTPTFQMSGQAGYVYTLQASTNLLDWADIATLVNTNGTVQFTDPTGTNYNARFYRAIVP